MSQQTTVSKKMANQVIRIAKILEEQSGRTPVYDPGTYQRYAESKSVVCWGLPVKIGDFLVAAAQPSPRKQGDEAFIYFDFIEDDGALVKPKKIKESEKCVHTEHCCVNHGCKYMHSDCPVWLGNKTQSFPCEDCSDIVLPITKAELKHRKKNINPQFAEFKEQECQPIV